MVRTRSGRRVEVPTSNALGNIQQGSATKSTLSTSMHWERLPSLVQVAVLKELADDRNRHSLEDRRRRASYAAVSLQWQEFFEKLDFNKLVLSQPALKDFRKIVQRRSPIIQSLRRLRTATNASSSLSRMPRIRHLAETSYRAPDIPERLIRPLEFDSFGLPPNKHKLPEVEITSSSIVRRQFYRELCPHTLSRLLREALTSV